MSEDKTEELSGPDLTQGDELSTVPDGTMLLGHARGIAGALVRRSYELFATLASALTMVLGSESGSSWMIRILFSWHHACPSLRTGESLLGLGLRR